MVLGGTLGPGVHMRAEGLSGSLYQSWREHAGAGWRVEWNEGKSGDSSKGVKPTFGDMEGVKNPTLWGTGVAQLVRPLP